MSLNPLTSAPRRLKVNRWTADTRPNAAARQPDDSCNKHMSARARRAKNRTTIALSMSQNSPITRTATAQDIRLRAPA